jgi:pimeloyl-ACP methyl ester carboxylesterase
MLFLFTVVMLSTRVCRSYTIQPGIWRYKHHPIAYEVASFANDNADESVSLQTAATTTTPLLLLNGFGVGSFHQHKLIHELMKQDVVAGATTTLTTIYAMDYLGQGQSWPEHANDGMTDSEQGLSYGGETWMDQIIQFIVEHIKQKVHVAGNSVGGHLAVCVAASRPDLVASLCLMNATPVWGLNAPGWSGRLPAPMIPKFIGRCLFDWIRDARTIQTYLAAAYANPQALDDNQLAQQIRNCTQGPGAHAAFASILWSPPIRVPLRNGQLASNFYESLGLVECNVLMLFGTSDPWCKPAVAKRMLRELNARPRPAGDGFIRYQQRYVELSSVGHCPNHEAPVAVANILSQWLLHEASLPVKLPIHGKVVAEQWGETILTEKTENDIQLSWLDQIVVAFV